MMGFEHLARPVLLVPLVLLGCAEDVLHVLPPFEGDGFLVFADGEAPLRVERAPHGDRKTFPEPATTEKAYFVRYDASMVAALHPEAMLLDGSVIELYESALDASRCPFGEAPEPNRRRFALPDSTWQVFTFASDQFELLPDGPSWRSRLRLSVPVAPGCGLSNPELEEVSVFPSPRFGGFTRLLPIGGDRWVGISAFGTSLLLMGTEPKRILREIRRAQDLGLSNSMDVLNQVVVDLERSPPVVVLATTSGLFRFRIVGDDLVQFSHEWPGEELLDLDLSPEGRVVAVSALGVVVTATDSTAQSSAAEPFGSVRIDRVRFTAVPDRPYIFGIGGGRLIYGDPFLQPDAVRQVQQSVRSWTDISVRSGPEDPMIVTLDTGGALAVFGDDFEPSGFTLAFPPEVDACSGPSVDACGFTSVEAAEPHSVAIGPASPSGGSTLFMGFAACTSILVAGPRHDCISTLSGFMDESRPGSTRPTVTPEGIYFLRLDGRVFRWNRAD